MSFCYATQKQAWSLTMKTIFLIVLLLVVRTTAAEPSNSLVNLAKYPYPFQAAVTVTSDTHYAQIKRFDAVHRLINGDENIVPGSPLWNELFPSGGEQIKKQWPLGIQGMSLPIADSFWFYGINIGLFKSFDTAVPKAIEQTFNIGSKLDGWLKKGWLDSLHTSGPGELPRAATMKALDWVNSDPQRRMSVWINHSFSTTPSSIEPDVPVLNLVLKNIPKSVLVGMLGIGLGPSVKIVLHSLGMQNFAQRIDSIKPYLFPPGWAIYCWAATMVLVIGFFMVPISLTRMVKSKLRFASIGILLSTSVLFGFSVVPMPYNQGDNPDSQYYSLDKLREAGFEYFWLTRSVQDYHSLINEDLVQPENKINGHDTIFSLVTVDDGSLLMTFSRNSKGMNGLESLQLMNEKGLDKLEAEHGTALLYTHWMDYTEEVFNVESLQALQRLQQRYQDGKIWVSSTQNILNFRHMRDFLDYSVTESAELISLNINGVDSPYGYSQDFKKFSLDKLCFEISDLTKEISLTIAGKKLDKNQYQIISHPENRMLVITQTL